MAVDDARAKSLLLAASDLQDAVERASYLDRECRGDPELRARLEALLRARDDAPSARRETEGTLIDPGAGKTESKPSPAPVPLPGNSAMSITADYQATLAPGVLIAERYTLQAKIGEGGMGEVWVAKQTEPVKRKVALKLIKEGMDSRGVLQRFEQERDALAMMDHPNIAKVFDAGLTPRRQPFFVIELVSGLRLTRFREPAPCRCRSKL